MIGIKGTGMSALALALHSLGIRVTGSDSPDSFLLLPEQRFIDAGIIITSKFDPLNIPDDVDVVVVTTSFSKDNSEIIEAKRRGIPVLEYPEMIGLLTQSLATYAVCGSHGKTTITNMLGWIAGSNGLSPLVIAGPTSPQVLDIISSQPPLTLRGGVIPPLKVRGGQGKLFILEADEYQNKLRMYHPRGIILTHVDLDHPDFFKSKSDYQKAFADFVSRLPRNGFLIYWADDQENQIVAKYSPAPTMSYGFSDLADYKIIKKGQPGVFEIHYQGTSMGIFTTPLMGDHNLLNTTAAILMARQWGLSNKQIQNSLSTFQGALRRLQKIDLSTALKVKGILAFDDYGHHPTEVKATLHALREAYPEHTIWTVFQPHTYSRTTMFLKEFGQAFGYSDHTLVLDIYASAREKSGDGLIHVKDVVSEIQKNKSDAHYTPTVEEAALYLKTHINPKSLILTIGAGDVWKIHALL